MGRETVIGLNKIVRSLLYVCVAHCKRLAFSRAFWLQLRGQQWWCENKMLLAHEKMALRAIDSRSTGD
jgi:hypothetical protein